MPLKVVSSQSAEDVRRKEAESDLEWPFRRLAANLIRLVRGAGRAEALPAQIAECLAALDRYQKATGAFPKARVYRNFLSLDIRQFDPKAWMKAGEDRAARMLAMSGYPERMEGERLIHRGALQVVASRLLYQNTQEIIGDHEMYEGVHLLKDSLAVNNVYWRRMKASGEIDNPFLIEEEPPKPGEQ
jgi:hypothetical protein